MCAFSRTRSDNRISLVASVLIATLFVRTCTATLPAPPSPADQWLYPDVNTVPTYNYLDTVNASWTSNFHAPYLLLWCRYPDDTAHYAYPYNRSVSATGSALVPLNDGNAWVCHFQVSDLGAAADDARTPTPPTFTSNDFNIVRHDGPKPVLWTNNAQGGGGPAVSSAIYSRTTSAIRSSSSSSATSVPPSANSNLNSTLSAPPPPPPPPSSTPRATLSKSQKVAVIIGSTMGALFFAVIAMAVAFVLRLRRSDRSAVVYGDGGVAGVKAPRERWKGVEMVSRVRKGGGF